MLLTKDPNKESVIDNFSAITLLIADFGQGVGQAVADYHRQTGRHVANVRRARSEHP